MSPAELRAALQSMRRAWPSGWPGLPQVWSACWARLALPGSDASPDFSPVLRTLRVAAAALARALEDEGRDRARDGREWAYHHRLHTADVLVSVTALMAQTSGCDGQGAAPGSVRGQTPAARRRLARIQAQIQARLLLAALIHDSGHLGRMNRVVFEQELRAFGRSLDMLRAHGVSAADLQALEQLLLATEPRWVGHIHACARQSPFDLQAVFWQAVLLTEADILASVLPGLGETLTRSLSREWERPHPQAARRLLEPQARIAFLRGSAHFSSPASHRLGLPQIVQAELRALEPGEPPAQGGSNPGQALRQPDPGV